MTTTTPQDEMAFAESRCNELNAQLDEYPERIDDIEKQLEGFSEEHAWKGWTVVGIYSQVGSRIAEMRKHAAS
jgi:predicted  nucleic acid-binding Zn-ribbon protein